MELPNMSDVIAMRKFECELKSEILKEIQHLKLQGYTDEDLKILFDGLSYISYPILERCFKNKETL